jgi:MazG family protein
MQELIKSFQTLIETTEQLLGPKGCPWDRKQTLESLKGAVLEEAHEVIDAIESKNTDHILEELADYLFLSLFLPLLAKKQISIGLKEVIDAANDKLVRRHPHVFGGVQVETESDLARLWEKVKQKEKQRKNLMEGIPKTLGSLAKAQKVIRKINYAKGKVPSAQQMTHEELTEQLLHLVERAEENGLECEIELSKALQKITGKC